MCYDRFSALEESLSRNRLFVSQDVLDLWIDDDKVTVDGSQLSLNDEQLVCKLAPAVLFVKEATGGDDPFQLVGRVKDEAQLALLGADTYMDSVLLEENAYDVQRGFVAQPLERGREALKDTIRDENQPFAEDIEASDELAAFLLDHLK